jgi:antitoxin component HigA of HigAB toxin-antitoxin module
MRVTKGAADSDSYMDLIRELPLSRIKSVRQHTKAMKMALRLSGNRLDRGSAQYLDVLVDLIADYEKRAGWTLDTSKVSAADLVRHRIDERGMSISELARNVGVSQSNLSDMLNGKRDWSKAAIRGLSSYLGIKAERFLA